MRAILAAAAITAIAISCSPFPARIRAEHAREFGCEQRWVQVSEPGPSAFRATGCGFQSEWVCREGECTMRDHRAYGVDGP